MERKRRGNKNWRKIVSLLLAVLLLLSVDTVTRAAEAGVQEGEEMPVDNSDNILLGEDGKDLSDLTASSTEEGSPTEQEGEEMPADNSDNILPGEDGKDLSDLTASSTEEGASKEQEGISNEREDTGELADETAGEPAQIFAAPRASTSVKLNEVTVGTVVNGYPFSPIASKTTAGEDDVAKGSKLSVTKDTVLQAMFDAGVASALSGKLYSYSLPKEHRNKKGYFQAAEGVSMTYHKVGTYEGKEIDLKVSLVAYENTSKQHTCAGETIPAGVFFRTNKLDFYTIGIEWAQFKFEFFDQSGSPVTIAGTGTLYDLDYGQKFTAVEGVDAVYVTKENTEHLQYTKTTNGYLQDNMIASSDRGLDDDRPENIPNGCVTLTYNSSSFTVSFGVPEATYTTLSSIASTFGLSGAYSTIDTPVLENPVKGVSTDEGDTDGNGIEEITNQGIFTYIIKQKIPMLHSQNYYKKFEIRDDIADCLEIVNFTAKAKAFDRVSYETVTDRFTYLPTTTTSKSEIIIRPADVESSDFYGCEYEFIFRVRLKQGYDLSQWLNQNSDTGTSITYTLPNTAIRYVTDRNNVETIENTNTVNVEGKLNKEFFYKGDADKKPITGAMTGRTPEFTIYSDEACTKVVGVSTYNSDSGLIRLPYLPLATSRDTVTYYMKETVQPTGYVPNSTIYTITQAKNNGTITIRGTGYESAKDGEKHGTLKNKAPSIEKTTTTEKNVKTGQNIWYVLTLKNPGNTDITVDVIDNLAPEVKGKEYKVNGSVQEGIWTGRLNQLQLPANGTVTIRICAEVIQAFSVTETEDNIIRNRASMIYDGKTYETQEVVHYLAPDIDYTLTKERITQPPEGLEGFFAGTGMEIQYEAKLTNTGDIPLKIDIKDAFHTEKYFEFIGDDSYREIELPVGESKTVIFKAKILSGAKPSIETTNEKGYKNTVTSTGTGSYTDPETQETVPVSIEKEASAYTPVIALPEYTLPDAGGIGTYWFTTGGVILMAASVLLLIKNRRKAPR